MTKLTAFRPMDWDVFAGAEKFADGGEPMFWEKDQFSIIVIADGRGLCLVNEEGQQPFLDCSGFTKRSVVAIADALVEAIEQGEAYDDVLRDFGLEIT